MPSIAMGPDGVPRLSFSSQDDLLSWLNAAIFPVAYQYGYRLTVDPIPKADVAVDRA
jgi:hypothetical protein